MKHERFTMCPDCKGAGRFEFYNEELGIGEIEECQHCNGEGSIDNPEYWEAQLPRPIPFKEGREAQLEYYNQKRNG